MTVPLGCRYDKHSDQPLVWVRSGASGFLGLISAAVCSDLGFLFKFIPSLTRWKVESHIGISQALGPIYVVQSHVCEQSSTLPTGRPIFCFVLYCAGCARPFDARSPVLCNSLRLVTHPPALKCFGLRAFHAHILHLLSRPLS